MQDTYTPPKTHSKADHLNFVLKHMDQGEILADLFLKIIKYNN